MIVKLLWMILPPVNLMVVLIASGWALARWRPRAGRVVLSLGALLFVVAGILPTGAVALHALERDFPPKALPRKVDGILVLGGAFDSRIARARGRTAFSDSGERIVEATRLMRLYPAAPVIYSDGNGRLDRSLDPETVLFRDYLRGQGVDDARVRYENRARNTYENILYSLPIAAPKPGRTWLVVTSAWHMRRSLALMRRQGWPGTVVPDPVDYQTTGTDADYTPNIDILGNLAAFNLAAREYLALASYRLRGRIDSGL